MAKRLNNAQKGEIVKLRSQGIDQRAVAAEVGCSQRTVSRIENNDPEVKAAIEATQRKIIIKGAPMAQKIVLSALAVGKRIWQWAEEAEEPGKVVAANKEALDLAHKNLKAVFLPMGFSGAPGQPYLLQQIYNDNRAQDEAAEVEEFGEFLIWKAHKDIAEAEIVEIAKDETTVGGKDGSEETVDRH